MRKKVKEAYCGKCQGWRRMEAGRKCANCGNHFSKSYTNNNEIDLFFKDQRKEERVGKGRVNFLNALEDL